MLQARVVLVAGGNMFTVLAASFTTICASKAIIYISVDLHKCSVLVERLELSGLEGDEKSKET